MRTTLASRVVLPVRAPAAARTPPGSVAGVVGYLERGVEKPYTYMYEPPPGVARENCHWAGKPVSVRDGRAIRASLSVDREGFELRDAPTSVRDFRDDAEVTRVYYEELRKLVLAATGARRVCVFDHLVRKREPGRPPLTFGRHGDGSKPAAVGRVHNDYSEASGQRRPQLVPGVDAPGLGQRFGVINVWRSIAGPILDTPLAVCDARSVARADLVPAEIRYPTRTGEIYLSTYNPGHRWYYFPRMLKDEAIVFKQFDSSRQVARYTLHSAFDLPDVAADVPLRESIEARCLVVYD